MLRMVILAALLLIATTITKPTWSQREQVENPLYRNWKHFEPGTSVTYRALTESDDGDSEVTTTYFLKERTEEKIVIELKTLAKLEGQVIDNPPQRLENRRFFNLPPGISKEEFGKPKGVLEEGEETVELVGQTFETKWFRARTTGDDGETFTKSWTSDKVPGRLIKSVSETPKTNTTTTVELIEIKTP